MMRRYTITNYKQVGQYRKFNEFGKQYNLIVKYNEFTVIAANRREAVKIADSILGHTNYSLPFDNEAEDHTTAFKAVAG